MNRSAHWRFPLALGGIVAISYGNSLSGSFHYDDFHSLVANPHVRTLTNIPSFFVDPGLFSSDADKAIDVTGPAIGWSRWKHTMARPTLSKLARSL